MTSQPYEGCHGARTWDRHTPRFCHYSMPLHPRFIIVIIDMSKSGNPVPIMTLPVPDPTHELRTQPIPDLAGTG